MITFGELVSDGISVAQFKRAEDTRLLQKAMGKLRSLPQQPVIKYPYLDDLEDDEIARRLGKTKQAVYHLRLRALARLKAIMT